MREASFPAVKHFPAETVVQSLWLKHELKKLFVVSTDLAEIELNFSFLFPPNVFYITLLFYSFNFPFLSPFFSSRSLPFNFFIFSSFNHCVLPFFFHEFLPFFPLLYACSLCFLVIISGKFNCSKKKLKAVTTNKTISPTYSFLHPHYLKYSTISGQYDS